MRGWDNLSKILNLEWVSDSIADDYKKWKPGDVVKISAQTGTGKTFLVTGSNTIEGLIDRMNTYENMIYICNRIELKRQIKLELLKKFNKEIPCLKNKVTGEFILDKNKQKILDTTLLDKITKIENIVITSYHAISNGRLDNIYLNENNNLDNFQYIVCDECHFFMTDSGFNNKAYLALEELINTRHRNAIKIFISATIGEVDKVIEKQVELQKEKGFGTYSNFNVHTYTTGIDYSYLDVKYFSNIKDMLTLIKNDKSDEKWLIFVTSKAKGEDIEKKLNDEKIPATFIYAQIGDNQEKKNITVECRFSSKVLISTKCLDNGINIKDKKVKNIIVMAYDKTTFIQEVGRVRVYIKNAPTINLYIPTFSYKTFAGKIDKNFCPKINDLELYWKDINEFQRKYNYDFDKVPKDIFYLDKKNEWKINLLGMARVYKDKEFAEKMGEAFKGHDRYAFIKEQLRWLELSNTFSENNLIENIADKDEIDSMEKFLEDAYDNDIRFEKDNFINEIESIIKAKLGSSLEEILNKLDNNHKREKGMKQYNKLIQLLSLPYVVSSKRFKIQGNLVTKWIITKEV